MKSILCLLLALTLLISLAACSGNTSVVGVWEQEMQTSILGVEDATAVVSLCRFTFREDGTGLQEHIMLDGKYPDAVREFHYHAKDDILTLVYEEEHMEEFTVEINKNSLKLENRRGSYDLIRVE